MRTSSTNQLTVLNGLLLFSHSVEPNSATPWTAECQASLSCTVSWSLLKLMSIELVMPTISSCIIPFSSCPQSFPVSESFSMSWLFASGGWSFSFITFPSNEYSRLIFFRIYWFDLLTVQGTPKYLLQHHSSKASFLWHSAFFMVQLSHPYMTTGKP